MSVAGCELLVGRCELNVGAGEGCRRSTQTATRHAPWHLQLEKFFSYL